jgi:hypothetical protein
MSCGPSQQVFGFRCVVTLHHQNTRTTIVTSHIITAFLVTYTSGASVVRISQDSRVCPVNIQCRKFEKKKLGLRPVPKKLMPRSTQMINLLQNWNAGGGGGSMSMQHCDLTRLNYSFTIYMYVNIDSCSVTRSRKDLLVFSLMTHITATCSTRHNVLISAWHDSSQHRKCWAQSTLAADNTLRCLRGPCLSLLLQSFSVKHERAISGVLTSRWRGRDEKIRWWTSLWGWLMASC